MATARERLLQSLSLILAHPFTKEGEVGLKRLLNTFRVQFKTASLDEEQSTARDNLMCSILTSWKNSNGLERKDIAKVIASFRMQLKQGNKIRQNNSEYEKSITPFASNPLNAKNKWSNSANKYENAYFKDKKPHTASEEVNSAVAGGPNLKSNNRGICPKCKSLGLVMSRSYGQDECHSCIYCGYQYHLKNDDARLDLCIAAQLLGNDLIDDIDGDE